MNFEAILNGIPAYAKDIIQILNNKQRSLDYARYGEQQLSGLGN